MRIHLLFTVILKPTLATSNRQVGHSKFTITYASLKATNISSCRLRLAKKCIYKKIFWLLYDKSYIIDESKKNETAKSFDFLQTQYLKLAKCFSPLVPHSYFSADFYAKR